MKYFIYWAYGLKVASEIEFPEMYALGNDVSPDLTIRLCDVKLFDEQIDLYLPYSVRAAEDKFFIHIKAVAHFVISSGNRIDVYPYQDAIPSDIRVYCLSNAFAAIFHQRKILPLHAGAITKDDKLSLIMGDTGAGKSTLLFHLMQKGWKVFSDDVVIATGAEGNQEILATASYPMMKLWKHQMKSMALGAEKQVRSGVDKFPYYFHNVFDTCQKTIEKIIILDTSSDATSYNIRKLKGVESLLLLYKQIYRIEYLSNVDCRYHISTLSAIANKIPCFEVRRPVFQACENELVDLFISI